MKTPFADIAADIIQKRLTGLLSLVVKNSERHLKIFFTDGEIYYMAYGELKDSECLANCEKLEFSECFFANDVKLTVKERLAVPTSTIIERLKSIIDKTAGVKPPPESAADTKGSSKILDKLKTALIRQIGPVGEIVFSKAVDNWRPSSPPTRQNLIELIDLMKEEIEDDNGRKEFLKESHAIIS